ncbi:MAG TPA: lipopolysaccharide heptosyltransferase II [Planctomycetota bacterium]|nr:lipopolysaccharide heptosyltransferase II [Planctomycetota bacterium]
MKRILVTGNNWLGDAVMSLPTLKSLRAMEPGARISVLSRPSVAGLYAGLPYVDETIVPPPREKGRVRGWLGLIRELKRRKFDTALILPRSFSSALTAFSARIPRRIGYAGDGRSPMLTDAVPRNPELLRVHRVHYYHPLLAALGKPPEPAPPTLEVPVDAEKWAEERLPAGQPIVGLNPGATYGEAKQWFPERFIEAGRRIARKWHASIVVVGGPAERELGDRVASEIGTRALSLSGRTTIPQLAAAIRRCALFLTNDTGPMHVADAVGVPVVAIFGPTDWVATPPFGKRHAIVRTPIDCSPCLKRVCPLGHHNCMKRVSVDDVFEACARFLGGPR